jgi:Glycosyl hydrolase family 26
LADASGFGGGWRSGAWFWWGAKDPDSFIKVWRHMFDYFTKVKGLDNLPWVYSPNHGAKTAAPLMETRVPFLGSKCGTGWRPKGSCSQNTIAHEFPVFKTGQELILGSY